MTIDAATIDSMMMPEPFLTINSRYRLYIVARDAVAVLYQAGCPLLLTGPEAVALLSRLAKGPRKPSDLLDEVSDEVVPAAAAMCLRAMIQKNIVEVCDEPSS